jgi:hypothetical protein
MRTWMVFGLVCAGLALAGCDAMSGGQRAAIGDQRDARLRRIES